MLTDRQTDRQTDDSGAVNNISVPSYVTFQDGVIYTCAGVYYYAIIPELAAPSSAHM